MIYTDTRVIRRTLWAFENKIQYIIHQGGTSSGKTFGFLYSVLTYLLYDRKGDSKNGERLRCSIVSENVPHLKRGALADFETIIRMTGLSKVITYNKTNKTFILPSGTIIEFFAVDNEEKARSGKRDILFVNEANSVDWMIFWQLSIRTKETIAIDYNPSAEFWFHSELLGRELKKGQYLFTMTTYLDNPALPEAQKRAIESIKDPHLARVYKEGKTGQARDLVISNVRYVDAMPKQLSKEGYGLDYGYSIDPAALVHAGIYQGEIYAEELFYETNMLNKDIVTRMKALGVSKKARIFADSAEPKSNADLKAAGFNIIPAKKGQDSIEYGLGLLNQTRLNIVRTSVNARSEVKKYKRDAKGNPIDKYNHFFDALRYWAMENMSMKKRVKMRIGSNKR